MKTTLIETLISFFDDFALSHDPQDPLLSACDPVHALDVLAPPIIQTKINALNPTTRIYTREESTRIDADALGFLSLIERSGLINHQDRERIIERALNIPQPRINRRILKKLLAEELPRGEQNPSVLAWTACLLTAHKKSVPH